MANNSLATVSMSKYLAQTDVNNMVTQMLGEHSRQFITAMTTLANSSSTLQKCDKQSLLACGLTAVSMNLELSPQLGFAYAVPYGDKCQFQIGAKGLVQLAIRSGQFRFINVIEVYENQFKSWDALSENLIADFSEDGEGKIVGYAAMFELNSGFRKTIFWSRDKVLKHAKKYSKTFNSGPWQNDFDGMAKKTVLKQLISRWAPLSTEMQTAITRDQAVIDRDIVTGEEKIIYADNEESIPTEPITHTQAMELVTKYGAEKVKSVIDALGIPDVKKIPIDSLNDVVSALTMKDVGGDEFAGTPFEKK